jgi:hypothetical protein
MNFVDFFYKSNQKCREREHIMRLAMKLVRGILIGVCRVIPISLNVDAWPRPFDVMVRPDRTICINTMLRVMVGQAGT